MLSSLINELVVCDLIGYSFLVVIFFLFFHVELSRKLYLVSLVLDLID